MVHNTVWLIVDFRSQTAAIGVSSKHSVSTGARYAQVEDVMLYRSITSDWALAIGLGSIQQQSAALSLLAFVMK